MTQAAHHERPPRQGEPSRKVSGYGVRIYADGTCPIKVGFPTAPWQVVCEAIVARREGNHGRMQDVLSDNLIRNRVSGENRGSRKGPDRKCRKKCASRCFPTESGAGRLVRAIGKSDRDARQQFLLRRVRGRFLEVRDKVERIQRIVVIIHSMEDPIPPCFPSIPCVNVRAAGIRCGAESQSCSAALSAQPKIPAQPQHVTHDF
jgi:hypothetical protein